MQKSPYEKARDENVRQRKELEKELNITNLSKRLDEAEVPDAEMSLLDDSNIDTDGDAIWGNKNHEYRETCPAGQYVTMLVGCWP